MTTTLTAESIGRIRHPGRCACHARASWSWRHRVAGKSGGLAAAVVWAGCPNCRGTAVGLPVSAADLARHERANGEIE